MLKERLIFMINSTLSLVIDMFLDLSLAVFAIFTWYTQREESKIRILFQACAVHTDELLLTEMAIALRNSEIINQFKRRLPRGDIIRLKSKMNRLRIIDIFTKSSITIFAICSFIKLILLFMR